MQNAIIILLGLCCGALLLRVYTGEKTMGGLARQLRRRKEENSTARLDFAAPNAGAEDLVAALNHLLEEKQIDVARFHERDIALRRQIANVSHDLRTPLTSILGYLQLLQKEGLSPQERQEYLDVMESRARALQNLITAFYDLSRLEGGEYPIHLQNLELRPLLEESLAEGYKELEGWFKQIRVELEPGASLVRADPQGVKRIFANLLGNAVQHGQEELRVTLSRQGDALVTAFSNRAPDMAKEDVSRVFQRSFTADHTRSGGNTGLGLAIVQALARQMGHQAEAHWADGWFTLIIRWKLAK